MKRLLLAMVLSAILLGLAATPADGLALAAFVATA